MQVTIVEVLVEGVGSQIDCFEDVAVGGGSRHALGSRVLARRGQMSSRRPTLRPEIGSTAPQRSSWLKRLMSRISRERKEGQSRFDSPLNTICERYCSEPGQPPSRRPETEVLAMLTL